MATKQIFVFVVLCHSPNRRINEPSGEKRANLIDANSRCLQEEILDRFFHSVQQAEDESRACGYVFAFLIIEMLRAARVKFGKTVRKINNTVAMETDPYLCRVSENGHRNILRVTSVPFLYVSFFFYSRSMVSPSAMCTF